MSMLEEYKNLIGSLQGEVFVKKIDLMPERPDCVIAEYYSNGYRTIHGIFEDGEIKGYNYKDALEDIRDMAPLRKGPGA